MDGGIGKGGIAVGEWCLRSKSSKEEEEGKGGGRVLTLR